MGKTRRKDGLPESFCRGNCKFCKDGKKNQKKRTEKRKNFYLDLT